MTGHDVSEFLLTYKKNQQAIENEIIEIIFYMNGSITYEEAWETSYDMRKQIVKTVSEIKKKQNAVTQ